MDGVHDLGGKQGFGVILYQPNANSFHDAWEVRANALNSLAMKMGIFNIDEYRHGIERMAPRHYFSASYYERVLTSLATLCVEKGLITLEELESRAGGHFPLAEPSAPGRTNSPDRRDFKIGETVLVRSLHLSGHARMPAYIRGKQGVVVGKSPAYPFPDAHAHGVDAENEPTYDVRFRSEELWPESSDQATIHVGVFQSYLERAAESR